MEQGTVHTEPPVVALMFNHRKVSRVRRLDRLFEQSCALLPRVARVPLAQLRPCSVLVLETQRLGDLVMTLPVLTALRQHYPSATITLAAHAPADELPGVRAMVDRIARLRVPWSDYDYSPAAMRRLAVGIGAFRRERFDLAVDCRGDLRNNLLLRAIGAARRVAPANTGGAYLLTDVVPIPTGATHLMELRHALLRHLGYTGPMEPPTLHAGGGAWLAPGTVLLHPGASLAFRRWPADACAALLARLRDDGAPVLLIAGPDDGAHVQAIQRVLGGAAVPVRMPSLGEFAALCASAACVVTMDSGPAHIAAASGAPVVVLFGPSQPEHSGPIGFRAVVVMAHDHTMAGISPDRVHRAVQEALGASKRQQHLAAS